MKEEFGMRNSEFTHGLTLNAGRVEEKSEFRIPNSELGGRV